MPSQAACNHLKNIQFISQTMQFENTNYFVQKKSHTFLNFNPFTTEARFYVLNAIAFSTKKRASVVKGLSGQLNNFNLHPLEVVRYRNPQL